MGLQAAEKLAASIAQAHQIEIATLRQELSAAAQAADYQKQLVEVSTFYFMSQSGVLLSIASIALKVCKL